MNDVFDTVTVINLDRRPDRLETMERGLTSLGIRFVRERAVDGNEAPVQQDYRAYLATRFPETAEPPRKPLDLYGETYSEADHALHIEAETRRAAISTSGSFAYLHTYRNIIRSFLESSGERLLVLDDDCLFHRHFHEIFAKAYGQLPPSWRILHLGTLQFGWASTSPFSANLYRPNGRIVGSHAVGYDRSVLPELLASIERQLLPFDIGALHHACLKHASSTFVVTPNLVIQSGSASDINSSEVKWETRARTHRWVMDDYAPNADTDTHV